METILICLYGDKRGQPVPVACTMPRPLMLADSDQHDFHLDKSTHTHVPQVLVGTISVQPELLHVIERRTRSLLREKLGIGVNSKSLPVSSVTQPTSGML